MFKEEVKTVHFFHAGSFGILPLFIAVIALVSLNSAFAETGTQARANLVSFVQKAAALIEKDGEAAFPQIRKRNGKWFLGDHYVFVWGLDGMRYVYPPDPSGEGKNMLHLKDVNGKPIGEWIVNKANSPGGRGWIHYQWLRPGEIFPAWKTTFVQFTVAPSGKAYIVGSGLYDMPLERTFIVGLVNDAARLLSKQGQAGFSRLKDKADEFIFMDTYVFVLAIDGTEMVNPAFPGLEGRNLLDHKDSAGKLLVREMIDKTQSDQSAWVEYYWARPGSADQVRKLAYIRRVQVDGEEMIVGAGLYEP